MGGCSFRGGAWVCALGLGLQALFGLRVQELGQSRYPGGITLKPGDGLGLAHVREVLPLPTGRLIASRPRSSGLGVGGQGGVCGGVALAPKAPKPYSNKLPEPKPNPLE